METVMATAIFPKTRAQKINEAMRQRLRILSKSIELLPGRSTSISFASLNEYLSPMASVTVDEMEHVYLPLMETTWENGHLTVTLNASTKQLILTNVRPIPGPDVLVYLSAILRLKDDGRRVFVEAFNEQRSTDTVGHLSVVEDWSYRFKEAGTLDFTYYEKLDARLATEVEFQVWTSTKRNGGSVYWRIYE